MVSKKRGVKAGKGSGKKTSRRAAAAPRDSVGTPTSDAALGSGYKASARVALRTDGATNARILAFNRLGSAACDDAAVFERTVAVVRDTSEPLAIRLAALAALQSASFSAVSFGASRPTFMAMLRAVAKDEEPELRQRALGILSREGDGRAQALLLQGLEEPSKALVPPEKALQLLSYNAKSEAYPMARQILERPPNLAAKREALRLLAADSKSVKLFERILVDKSEVPDIRQIAATALHALAPDRLQSLARDIVLDAGDAPEMQALSLTAISQFGDAERLSADSVLRAHVSKMSDAAIPSALKQSATQYLGRYGR